jgi:folate-binding protein YgfZ
MKAKLIAAGAVESTEDLIEVLRIEERIPKFGVDMDTETIPLEAGIEDRAISMTKGCYVGQEVIVRVLHRGHGRVARKLVGLLISGDAVPQKGDRLFADGKEIGEVTSAALSPLLKGSIALAYVPRVLAVPGTEVEIAGSAGRLRGRVADQGSDPFVTS